ncbi:Inner membrane protein yhjX [uncultured Roseburia sp.]|uniref:MFS transporter n=1 Tax=Brotonthovivens ammoniilytica TaxID=2981725 RepID=A0ABT2TG58_9FIRM|nr:MFS transporter [Brotonthovivens ammoniilytica]MCU6761178.1 MFS transporter [Brotonthovivens ammoniilytica]SCI21176.1 Inner membrane protein yhjX [uncultured Roseburia sp.]
MKRNMSELFGFGKGWGTIIYCLLMFWFYAGMVNDSSNIVAPAVAERLGIPAGNVLNMGTVAAMVGVIFFFILGWVNRKIGARMTSFICLILAGIGYFGMGHAGSLVQYGISLCVCTIGAMSAGYIAGGALVASWFPKKKGIVMGYTTMGHNMATGFFVPLITILVVRLGVKNAVVIPAVLVIVLAVMGLFLMRNTPQERGVNPDNVSDEEYHSQYFNSETDDDGGWTVKKLFSKKTFWLVAVASGGFQFVSTIIITQLVVRNQQVGFTQAQAVKIMTILAFAGIAGSWIIGALDQKIGTKKTMIFFGIWYAAALLLEVTEIPALVIVFLIMFALALGGSANFTTSLPAAVFGRHGFKKVNSVLFPIQALVSSFGFMVNGNVLNATGSLRMSYVIAAIASVGVVILVLFINEHEYNRDFMTEEQAEALTKQLKEK